MKQHRIINELRTTFASDTLYDILYFRYNPIIYDMENLGVFNDTWDNVFLLNFQNKISDRIHEEA